MEKLRLNKLKGLIRKRSTIHGVPKLLDLLKLNGRDSEDETFVTIVESALRDFETYRQLVTDILIFMDSSSSFIFEDNSEGVLNGSIDRSSIQLIPNSILGYSSQRGIINNYYRDHIYERPELIYPRLSGAYYIRGVFTRPILEEYDSSNRLTDRSCILFLNENKDIESSKFIDQCLLSIISTVDSTKRNITIPNFPIELYESLDLVKTQLENELDIYYKEALNNGSIII